MVGAKAAMGNGLVAGVRHGLFEQMMQRVRAWAAQADAAQLDATTWTEEAWRRDAGAAELRRDLGATPLRWVRLT